MTSQMLLQSYSVSLLRIRTKDQHLNDHAQWLFNVCIFLLSALDYLVSSGCLILWRLFA